MHVIVAAAAAAVSVALFAGADRVVVVLLLLLPVVVLCACTAEGTRRGDGGEKLALVCNGVAILPDETDRMLPSGRPSVALSCPTPTQASGSRRFPR